MALWYDFSRRNDPAHVGGLEWFDRGLAGCKEQPAVVCFWTKNPGLVAKLYRSRIQDLLAKGTLVLAYVTVTGYGKELEPGVPQADLSELVKLLGTAAIRLRFDPIIIGYTKPSHLAVINQLALEFGIEEMVVNFLVPDYKDVNFALPKMGIPAEFPTPERGAEVLGKIRERTDSSIRIQACAETHMLFMGNEFGPEWLGRASCADRKWALRLRPDLGPIFGRASRKGCGCEYSGDWGEYFSRGSYKCPHRCVYCYAK